MTGTQLPLFKRKIYKAIYPAISVAIPEPSPEKTILETLPAYHAYLQNGGFSQYTPDDFTGDLKKFGVFAKAKPIKDIQTRDIKDWIAFLKTPVPKARA